jgi:hypothetical protein
VARPSALRTERLTATDSAVFVATDDGATFTSRYAGP